MLTFSDNELRNSIKKDPNSVYRDVDALLFNALNKPLSFDTV